MKILFALPFVLALTAVPTLDSAAPPAGEHDWVVDPVHSSVIFRIKHAGAANFYASFDSIEGTVTLDPAAPDAGKVELVIPVESVDSRNESRDKHLKSPDFFNSKENPEIRFTSQSIAKADGASDAYEVTGVLAMAGVEQPLTLRVEKTGEGEFRGKRLGYETKFVIERSKFGMNYGIANGVIGDEVTLMVALELVKPK